MVAPTKTVRRVTYQGCGVTTNNMIITIDNRDTNNVHIDTYQMLTGEYADEMMREYEKENALTDGRVYDEYADIDYDMPAIREGLARASISVVLQAIIYTPAATIIEDIKLVKTASPKFYNYTTDSYTADYTINPVALNEYIKENYTAILERVQNYSGGNTSENMAYAAVCHLIDETITADDYNMAMWEVETEIYYENMSFSKV